MKIQGINTYLGGKESSGVFQTIINQIRPHQRFISPFLGNCAVLRYKLPAKVNVGIDRDQNIIELWQQAGLEKLKVYCGDGIAYLEYLEVSQDEPTVVYCDPPYPISTRVSQHRYNFEMTDDEHLRLLTAIKKLDCDVLISTYANDLYSQELQGWPVIQFTAGTRGGPAIESLYMNFENPEGVLHDYRFLGEGFSDRQRVRRKIKRWSNKLRQLPSKERNAILASLSGPYRHK